MTFRVKLVLIKARQYEMEKTNSLPLFDEWVVSGKYPHLINEYAKQCV